MNTVSIEMVEFAKKRTYFHCYETGKYNRRSKSKTDFK